MGSIARVDAALTGLPREATVWQLASRGRPLNRNLRGQGQGGETFAQESERKIDVAVALQDSQYYFLLRVLLSVSRTHSAEESPMASIEVSQPTYNRLTDLARAWEISEDATIVRLIDSWKQAGPRTADRVDEVPVHALYGGRRAEGIYHPSTGRIDIVSGVAAGKTGLKPSAAAAEVVKVVNPKVNPSRNGWSFWIVNQSGQILQMLRS